MSRTPASRRGLASTIPPGNAKAVAISGSLAYVVDGSETFSPFNNALHLIDISNPLSPTEVSSYTNSSIFSIQDVETRGSWVYLTEAFGGLRLIDVSNPLSPTEVDLFYLGSLAAHIKVVDPLIYVTSNEVGMYILRHDYTFPPGGGIFYFPIIRKSS